MASSHRSRSPERRRAVEGVDGASAVSRRGQPRPKPVTASSTPVASEAYIEVDLDAAEDERELSAVGRRAQLLPEPVSLHPVCDRIPPFPAEGLLHAMAFDGEVYDKSAFFSYYDDAAFHVWNECQVRTHAAASFVHIWFNWTLQYTWGQDLMVRFANSVRAGREWLDREGDWWRLRLVQFVFRALALRDEFLALNDLHQMHGNYNNEWSRKKMIEIAMTWTTKYRVHGAATSERTRSVLRLVWQHWFGSKDFALLVAAEGVMDWKKIVASLSHLLQTEEFRSGDESKGAELIFL